MVDPQLLARIDAVEPINFAGEAFRHLAQDRHPLSGTGARTHGGRWNPPESFSTLYLALERETTVREFYRAVKRQGRAPEDFLARRMYRYEVSLAAVLDLREPATRAELALGDAEVSASDAAACRQIGECAHYLSLEGILAPSATGAGVVLAVFFDRLRADSLLRDLDHEPWVAAPVQPPAW